ncbi:hypothetical protein AWM75_01460 [Aerococcus urinaehominis]|uniref:Folate transporter n=2 Tax=Aerococcus urinaehominis TaxID=128944 RepID=A0A0X8FMG4_9LACT|nr:hypothetical protein AWM75_01460 [Aerococcus urinaehominis]
MSSAKLVAGMGVLIALNLVLNQFRLVISPTWEINFSFVTLAIMGAFYGPVYAGVAAGFADILGFMLSPSGFFFPGFTLNSILSAVIYGLLLFRHPYSLKRLVVAKIATTILVSLILTPLWLNMMYQNAFFSWARIVRTVIQFPINLAILLFIFKTLERIPSLRKLVE